MKHEGHPVPPSFMGGFTPRSKTPPLHRIYFFDKVQSRGKTRVNRVPVVGFRKGRGGLDLLWVQFGSQPSYTGSVGSRLRSQSDTERSTMCAGMGSDRESLQDLGSEMAYTPSALWDPL